VVDGDAVGPDHWLGWVGGLDVVMAWVWGAYEFVVGFHASEDEAVAFGGPQLGPFFLVCAVDVVGEVLGPVYAAGFGVADVGYVVHMAFGVVLERWVGFGWWWFCTLLAWSEHVLDDCECLGNG